MLVGVDASRLLIALYGFGQYLLAGQMLVADLGIVDQGLIVGDYGPGIAQASRTGSER